MTTLLYTWLACDSPGGADIHILPDADDEEFVSPLQMPHTWYKRLYWLLMLPASVTFMLTVPNCQRPGCWQRLYVITFIISIAWIAALSYIMVWMVTVIGKYNWMARCKNLCMFYSFEKNDFKAQYFVSFERFPVK